MSKLNTIYIISKGRPQCKTAEVLTRMKYTGEWFIVCGNNDDTLNEYKKNWGENRILEFDWYREVEESNLLDNFGVETMSSGAVPVRNATQKISRDRGELRHWQMDDDFTGFYLIDKEFKKFKRINNGAIFEHELNKISSFAYDTSLANVGICMGSESYPKLSRKFSKRVFGVHNMSSEDSLFVKWRGRMNDDLINAIDVYHSGKMEMTLMFMNFVFKKTQAEKGGNTDIYKLSGTVRKTAYAVMVEPNATSLVIDFGRYHHYVDWKKITPKLIRASYAKV